MARSVWKGPFVDGYLLKKAEASRSSGRHEMIRIWSRRSTILPQFVGLTFGVYNGQKHIPVMVTEEMVGHKFGEFSPTRSFYGHTSDRKAKRDPRTDAGGRLTGGTRNDHGQARTRAGPSRQRGQGGRPHAAGIAAEAQSRRAVDPRQEGGDCARRSSVFQQAHRQGRARSAWSWRSPTPRTTTISTSTNWSSPRRMSARRWCSSVSPRAAVAAWDRF